MRWPTGMLVIPLFSLACGQGSSPSSKMDGGGNAVSDVGLTLPEIPPGCPPDAGNENGIGKPCTATGTECTGTLQCSCKNWFGYTMPASMPCFCTNVQTGKNNCLNCGSKTSCCSYTIPLSTTTSIDISACFPAVCAPNDTCPQI